MKFLQIIIITLFPFALTLAEIIHVPTDALTIQQGINQAQTGDTVLVAEGHYYENIQVKGINIILASEFFMDGDTSHISKTIIDGSQHSNPDSGTVVMFEMGKTKNSTICGFTITGGSGTVFTYGSSIFCAGGGINITSSGTIDHNRITKNEMNRGTGIWCNGTGIMAATLYSNNNVDTVLIINNEISYNTTNAYQGGNAGALLDTKGLIEFKGNDVKNNIFTSTGGYSMGAISVFGGVDELGVVLDGVINLSDNIIKYNVVKGTSFDNGCGGGIYIVNCSPKINNNIIMGNSTVGYGGGIYISNGPTVAELTIINNTLINNSAQYGGGISVYSENALKTLLHLDNSILWGNIAVTSGSQIYKQSGTLTVNYSDIQGGGFEGAGKIDSDPMLKDSVLQGNDTVFCCLSTNSPCIDAGDPAWLDIPDQNNPDYALWPAMGMLRSDIGAYGGKGGRNPEGIDRIDDGYPTQFQLKQNYPNPFNPSTQIKFQIPNSNFVTLEIYDLLGQKVATLVNENLNSGIHIVEWNAAGFASGVYLYRLQAGNYMETKKLILLR